MVAWSHQKTSGWCICSISTSRNVVQSERMRSPFYRTLVYRINGRGWIAYLL